MACLGYGIHKVGVILEEEEDAPRPSPLERFAGGGWRRGIWRVSFGAAILTLVLWLAPGEAWTLLAQPQIWGWVAVGTLIHLVQRGARIAKWREMIMHSGLRQYSVGFLFRVQLVGMLANLLLPVSEALKIWTVSRTRADGVVATKSIASDTALHAALMGLVGLIAAATSDAAGYWSWCCAAAMLLVALAVITALRRWPRTDRQHDRLTPAVWLWCALETAAQLALYLIALRAVDVELPLTLVLAYSPMLFVADLVMVTPSGIGVRESIFALVLQVASVSSSAEVSVATGLVVSAMLLLAAIVGGVTALAWPGQTGVPSARRAR